MMESENEARAWVKMNFNVPRETMARLDAFVERLRQENERQNLVAGSTLGQVWGRHIADSAQLLHFAPSAEATWLDIGTGAGFPGLVIAALHRGPVMLVEPRKLRAAFLEEAASILDVRPRILVSKLERVAAEPFDVISSRAVARCGSLLLSAARFSTEKTRFVLPKGRSAHVELEEAKQAWQGDFRLEPSLTDPDARIIVAEHVRPLRQRKPA